MVDNELRAKGFVVWGICALFFLYEFLLRMVVGTFQPSVTKDLGLNSFQFSLLSTSLFLLTYGIMQIPAGLIIDHIGLKKSLLIGALCCSLSSIGLSYSHSFEFAIVSRIFMGFGASFGFICLLISVHDWMPHKYSAIFIGLSQFIGTMGPILGAGPLESLSHTGGLSWRFTFLCLGGAGLVLTILVLLFVENNHHQSSNFTILRKPEKISTSIMRLFTRAQPWYLALVSTALYFTIEYLSENEGRAFLILKGVSPISASYMLTISWIGYAIGCPLVGLISDMLERRNTIIKICALIGLGAILTILYTPGRLSIQIGFFLLGISASGQSIGFATMAEQFKKQFVAVGFGLNNGMIMGITAINAPLIGLYLDHIKSGEKATLNEYQHVFNILIFIAIAGIVISFAFVKETFCKSTASFTVLTPKKT